MTRSTFAVVLFALALGACGSPPRPVVPVRAALPPLLDLVPDGASLVVVARPDVLWASPVVRRIVAALVETNSLDTMATRTGVDPRLVTEAVLAEYPGGILLFARGPFVATELVAESEVRMSVVESRSDAPFVRRAGLFGTDRRELVALDRNLLVVATDPAPLSSLLACITAPSALSRCRPSVGPGAVRAAHTSAPLVLFAPRHLELPPGLGAALLLAEERTLAVDATPNGNAIHLALDLRGDFPPGADVNFRALCESVGRTELGEVLGLSSALPSLSVTSSTTEVHIGLDVEAGSLSNGLRTLFGADIRQMIEVSSS